MKDKPPHCFADLPPCAQRAIDKQTKLYGPAAMRKAISQDLTLKQINKTIEQYDSEREQRK